VVVFRGIDSCAPSIRDTVATALTAGSFTDAMGRRIPLGTTIDILTAPGLGSSADGPPAAILAARLGPALLAACDVVTGTTSSAAADARAGWIQRELLDPLADRLGRAGYVATFDPTFIAWLDRHLPTDGSSPQGFLDADVTARIALGLPSVPGPVTIGIVDDQPAIVAGG
jgi:hypothetical protein